MSHMSTALGGMGLVLVVILFFHLISLSIALIYLVIRQGQEERKKGLGPPLFFFFWVLMEEEEMVLVLALIYWHLFYSFLFLWGLDLRFYSSDLIV